MMTESYTGAIKEPLRHCIHSWLIFIGICSEGNRGDLEAAGSLHHYLVKLHQQYGDIVSFWLGKEYIISIASPELFKQHSHLFDRPCEFSQQPFCVR